MARFLFVVVFLTSSLTFAQGAPPAPAADEPEVEVRYKRKTFIEISEQSIEGKVKGPAGTRVVSRGKPKFKNLIAIRRHFRAEMLDSANGL